MEFCNDKFLENYYNDKLFDVKNCLNKEQIDILEKLEIHIKSENYTEYELDNLKILLLKYLVKEDDMNEDDLKRLNLLKIKGLTVEDCSEVLENLESLALFN